MRKHYSFKKSKENPHTKDENLPKGELKGVTVEFLNLIDKIMAKHAKAMKKLAE